MTDRLTVNAGLRYDIVTGFDLDQSEIPNYIALTAAAAAGRFNGVAGLRGVRQRRRARTRTTRSRASARVYDLRGDGKDVIRAGWGIYYDFGYTNANILVPGPERPGRLGRDLQHQRQHGRHPESRRLLLRRRPADLERREPERGQPERAVLQHATWRRPASEQPWTSQTSVGWSHQLTPSTVFDVDYVHIEGTRPRRPLAAQHAHQRRRPPLRAISPLNPPTRR